MKQKQNWQNINVHMTSILICVDVEEYALEYCDTNTDGEFVNGSDYDLAEREEV